MPFSTLGLYAEKKVAGMSKYSPSKEDELFIEEVLLLEDELFKEDDCSIRWTVVQLYRNLLVVVINIFVLNTIYRSVIFFPVFGFFILQDRDRLPYKHLYLNYL